MVGPLTAVIAWAELGDCRRLSRSMQGVRHAGLDVTVHASDLHRPGGSLSREGPSTLRWALFEAATWAARPQARVRVDAGVVLRSARHRAGLSQAELARAGPPARPEVAYGVHRWARW